MNLVQRVEANLARRRPGGRKVQAFIEVLGKGPVPKGNGREIFYPLINGRPPPKCRGCGRPKGRAIVRETTRVKAAERVAVMVARLVAPRSPLTGAVRADVITILRIAPSWTQWKQEAARAGLIWPTRTHDGDRGNHLKMLEDVLERAGFVKDDAQITTGEVAKVYGDRPGYLVRAFELEQISSFKEWRDRATLGVESRQDEQP